MCRAARPRVCSLGGEADSPGHNAGAAHAASQVRVDAKIGVLLWVCICDQVYMSVSMSLHVHTYIPTCMCVCCVWLQCLGYFVLAPEHPQPLA